MANDYSQFIDRPGVDGWVGGLMDEYARAAVDFCRVLEAVPAARFTEQRPSPDPDCVSIQALCIHVVRASHGYANLILRTCDQPVPEIAAPEIRNPAALRPLLAAAMRRTEAVLHEIAKLPPEQQAALVIKPRSGLPLEVDLLVEHAIVHLLRHRRQIERW
jgi:uncharacterized damage-inducible protein DinB